MLKLSLMLQAQEVLHWWVENLKMKNAKPTSITSPDRIKYSPFSRYLDIWAVEKIKDAYKCVRTFSLAGKLGIVASVKIKKDLMIRAESTFVTTYTLALCKT